MSEYIKLGALLAIRALLLPFKVFPIKTNRIIFNSYNGKQYSCNPKYISEYLVENHSEEFEIIWAFRTPERFVFLTEFGIKICKYRSIKYFYYKLTAKFSICNNGWGAELPGRRKKCHEINTWHGGGDYKKVGAKNFKINHNFPKKIQIMLDNRRYDYFISSSEKFTKHTLRDSFNYKGKVLDIGMPRNDILLSSNDDSLHIKIKKNIGVSLQKKVLLYAPTWRENTSQNKPEIDFEKLLEAAQQKLESQVIILVRLHYMSEKITKHSNFVLDVTDYPDMQQLLYISDILVTDYSSSMWDFSLTKKPCFLFCPDLKNYSIAREFYTPINNWGFPVSEDMDELCIQIKEFDDSKYLDNINNHHKNLKSYEQGDAREKIYKIISNLQKTN